MSALLLASGCIAPALSAATEPGDEDRLTGCGAVQDAGALSLICPVTTACDPRALAPAQIRIVDWNIKNGSQRGLDAVIDTIRGLDPDIVLLQEVDRDVERSGNIDEPQAIAEGLGPDYHYVFAPTLELEGGLYGIAALSRLPFHFVTTISLTNTDAAEPRTAIDARLCAGQRVLRVVDHHADYQEDGAANSCNEILDALQHRTFGGTVFAGDFNQTPSEPGPSACVQAGYDDVLGKLDDEPTFDADRIDYFFVDDLLADRVLDGKVVQTDASDHRLIMMDLTLHGHP